MAQFDVYLNPNEDTSKAIPYLLDVQADLLDRLATLVVVPLILTEEMGLAAKHLNPQFKVKGVAVVMSTAELAGIPNLALPPADEPGEAAGQGLFRETLENGTLIGYDGGVLGFGGVMGWVEGEDLVIVILTNVGTMHAGDDAYYPLKLVKTASFVTAARRLARELSPPHAPGGASVTAPSKSELNHP